MLFSVFFGSAATCGTYTSMTLPASMDIVSAASNGTGTLIAAKSGGVGSASVIYSTNGGATWTEATGTNTGGYGFVISCWIDGRFIVREGSGYNQIQYSANGSAFTTTTGTYTAPTTDIAPGVNEAVSVTVGASDYMLVSGGTESSSDTSFWSTLDGVDYVKRNLLPYSGDWGAMCKSPSTVLMVMREFAAAATDKIATHAYDGNLLTTAWTGRATSQVPTIKWFHAFYNGRCFFLAENSTTKACRSYDEGATFENVTLPSAENRLMVCNPETGAILVAGGNVAVPTTSGYCSLDDGDTWDAVSVVENKVWQTGLFDSNSNILLAFGTTDYAGTKGARASV